MARKPRLFIEGCPQHIIQRGNNRQACFHEETDYSYYLYLLKEVAEAHSVAIHSFVLMTNHVHLLATGANEMSIPRMMHSLGARYVRFFNDTYQRTGTLWEGRYRASVVANDNYYFTVSRYIELNPVRAGMVVLPGDYSWSSYLHNALGVDIGLIKEHQNYKSLGNTRAERAEKYRSFFSEQITLNQLKDIRDAVNKRWFLGTMESKLKYKSLLGSRFEPLLRGGDRKSVRFNRK